MAIQVVRHAASSLEPVATLTCSRHAVQCAILSSGRIDNQYVLTEEPDVSDKLTDKLRQMSAVSASVPRGEEHGTGGRRAGDHLNLPFELRMLEMALDEACGLLGVEVRGVVASASSRMAVLQASVVRAHWQPALVQREAAWHRHARVAVPADRTIMLRCSGGRRNTQPPQQQVEGELRSVGVSAQLPGDTCLLISAPLFNPDDGHCVPQNAHRVLKCSRRGTGCWRS